MNKDLAVHPDRNAQRVARLLVFAFGATTVMWLLCYVAMLQPGKIVGEALFVMIILTLFGASAMAGATSGGTRLAVIRGVWIGAISATLNLLLIGSILGGKSQGDMATWLVGLFAGSILVSAIGGFAGSKLRRNEAERFSGNWIGAFTLLSACIVFLMIVTGGIVTGFEAGLAVPDWPNSYGHNMLLYPLSEMISDLDNGIYYEHAHRLTGMYVGLTVLTMSFMLWWGDRRLWIGILGSGLLMMVIIQGVLGGLRVTGHLTMTDNPDLLSPNTALGIVHGVFGQIFFGGMVFAAAATTSLWSSRREPDVTDSASSDRVLGWMLVVALIFQLMIGAAYRHLTSDLGARSDQTMLLLMGHIFMAVFVAVLVVINGLRASTVHQDRTVLKRTGLILLLLVCLQILLGVLATVAVMMRSEGEGIPSLEVLATSAHQANGALLLGAATLLAGWYGRLLKSPCKIPATVTT